MRLFPFFFLFYCSILSAQYSKGTLYFGQESGIEFLSESDGLVGGIGLRARGGFFLRDRWLVGASIEAGEFDGPESSDQFLITPFSRYYLPFRKSKSTHLFGEASLTTNLSRDVALSFSFALGAEYQLGPGAMLTASVRQTIGTQLQPDFTTVGLGFNVLLGQEHTLDPSLGHNNKAGNLFFNPSIGNATFGTNASVEFSYATIQLDGGIFLSDNVALMLQAGYNTSMADIGTDLIERVISSKQAVLATGLRYQINNGREWQPYAQGGIRFSKEERRGSRVFIDGVSFDAFNFTNLSYDIGGGIMYHLSTNIALDLGLSWRPILSSDYPISSPGDQVTANFRLVVFPSRSSHNQDR